MTTEPEKKELKLALVIMIFVLVASISPYVWNQFDRTPVVASATLKAKPRPEYILKNFFRQIDMSGIQKALDMMNPETTKYTEEIWKEDFKNIYFIKLRNLELKSEKENERVYFTRLDVRLKGTRVKSSWKNGQNERLVVLKNINDQWYVSDIRTVK